MTPATRAEALARIPASTLLSWPRPLPRGAQPHPAAHRAGCRAAGYSAPNIPSSQCPRCSGSPIRKYDLLLDQLDRITPGR